MTEHVFCQDALTQTLCRQGTFSFCGAEIGSKSVFERRATTGSGTTFFSFYIPYLHANKFVFTKSLYSHHETRFA